MSLVEGFSEDDCRDACLVESHDIFCASYASAGNQMTLRIAAHNAPIELQGRSFECAVSANLRTKHVLRAFKHVTEEEILEQNVRILLPSVDGDLSVPDISTQDEMVRTIFREPSKIAVRVCDGYASSRYHCRSCIERLFQVVVALHASAKVDDETGVSCDGVECREVHDMLTLSAVQVDYMQPSHAQILELLSHFERVSVDFLRVVIAFGKPYALAFDDIYCRNELYHSSRKLRSILCPTSPLFSGWNCVAKKLSFCMAELKG